MCSLISRGNLVQGYVFREGGRGFSQRNEQCCQEERVPRQKISFKNYLCVSARMGAEDRDVMPDVKVIYRIRYQYAGLEVPPEGSD